MARVVRMEIDGNMTLSDEIFVTNHDSELNFLYICGLYN